MNMSANQCLSNKVYWDNGGIFDEYSEGTDLRGYWLCADANYNELYYYGACILKC